MTDEHILAGFANLHEAITTGFDAQRESFRMEMDARFAAMNERIGGLEHRMMRRFDAIEARLDNHEGRIAALEAKP